MAISRRNLILSAPGMLSLQSAWAQSDYPNRPIRIVAPFAAGAATDVLMRRLSEPVGKLLGQPFVIENRPGANGAIAGRIAAKAPADGYTLMIAGNSSHAAGVHTMRDLGYDPIKDFTPITQLTLNPQILVVNADLPVRNLQEFIKYAKDRPGKLSYGTGNTGSLVAAMLLKSQTGIDAVGVNYPGVPQATTDLLAGRLDFIMNDPVVAAPFVKNGKLRVLGVTSKLRLAAFPDVEPLAEQGFRNFDYASWSAVVAPAGVPPAIVQKIQQAFVKVMADPAIQKFVADAGIIPATSTPDGLHTFMVEQIKHWGIWAKEAGLPIN
jgi:tripartite-type tricarboxylate transporter receptor subunit TctC